MPMVITAATARTRSVSGASGGASRSHRLMNWSRNIFLRAPLSDISVCMAAWFCSMKRYDRELLADNAGVAAEDLGPGLGGSGWLAPQAMTCSSSAR